MTTTNNSQSSGIDRVRLLERCLGIDSFAEKIATAFVATLPSERTTLRTAISNTDLSQAAKHAHRLKGSAANVCAEELSAAAAAVEQAAKNNLVQSIEELLDRLDHAVDRILHENEDGPIQS